MRTLFGLFDLQLRQEIDEPLEGALIPVDPKEVHLPQVQDRRRQVVGPFVVALGTRVPRLPIPVHDRLEDAGERRDPDSGADQNRVLRPENLGRRGSERPVDVDDQRLGQLDQVVFGGALADLAQPQALRMGRGDPAGAPVHVVVELVLVLGVFARLLLLLLLLLLMAMMMMLLLDVNPADSVQEILLGARRGRRFGRIFGFSAQNHDAFEGGIFIIIIIFFFFLVDLVDIGCNFTGNLFEKFR